MSRRVDFRTAMATLEAYARDEADWRGIDLGTAKGRREASAHAEARLNRPTRRALGHRGDGRFHPLAARKDVPRGRR